MSYDYNEISKLYDEVREADLKSVEFLVSSPPLGGTSRVLEIGCGTGNYLRLVHQLSQAETWGIDSSQGMLSKAKEKCPEAVLVQGDAVELADIPDASFDLVYMVDVIHHIKNIDLMFQNIYRVLRKDGKLVIFSDNYEHIRNRLTTKYFPETLAAELNRYQDTPELIQSLSHCGFLQIQPGVLQIGEDSSFGPKLIEIAARKGYSMFGLIPEEAIEAGIVRIQRDLKKEAIVYHQRVPYVMAIK